MVDDGVEHSKEEDTYENAPSRNLPLTLTPTLLPHGEAWISETGSHFAMYDDQQNYSNALLRFLKA